MKKSYRNVAFLVELLVNIFVFSVACAILVGLFGKAGQLARGTRERDFATTEIYALFETAKAHGVQAATAAGDAQDDTRTLFYYDKNWKLTSAAGAAYIVEVTATPEGGNTLPGSAPAGELDRLTARASDAGGREICTMQTAVYQPAAGNAGAEEVQRDDG